MDNLEGVLGVRNPDDWSIPAINDLTLQIPPTDQDDTAGASAAALYANNNTEPLSEDNVEPNGAQIHDKEGQDLVPPKNTGQKGNRDFCGLGTTNHPGYTKTPINPSVTMVRKRGLEPSKGHHRVLVQQFDDAMEDFMQLSDLFDPGNETAAVDQYTCLELLAKNCKSRKQFNRSVGQRGGCSADEEVHSGVVRRQEEMRKRCEQAGINYLMKAKGHFMSETS